MSDLVPAHRYASLFGTNRFGSREDVVEEYEIAAGFDWAKKKRVAALLQRNEALLNESKARGVLILVWLSQHVFVASFYPGEVQNAVYLYRRPDIVTDQPQAHEGIHNTTVTRLDFQFPGNETCFCSYAVGFDPFLTILAVEQPLQECLRIWFSNKELSVEQGRLLGLFYGTLFLSGCIFRVGGIAFARSLHENPNQRPRRIIIHGLLRRALEVNMHLDSFVVGSDIPRGTTLSGILPRSSSVAPCAHRNYIFMICCQLRIGIIFWTVCWQPSKNITTHRALASNTVITTVRLNGWHREAIIMSLDLLNPILQANRYRVYALRIKKKNETDRSKQLAVDLLAFVERPWLLFPLLRDNVDIFEPQVVASSNC